MKAVETFLKVAKLTNKGQFERCTVRNLPKVCISSRTKTIFFMENYSEIRKCPFVPILYKKNHSLIMQMQSLYEYFPESPWVSLFTYHTTATQSSVYAAQDIARNENENVATKGLINKSVAQHVHFYGTFPSRPGPLQNNNVTRNDQIQGSVGNLNAERRIFFDLSDLERRPYEFNSYIDF